MATNAFDYAAGTSTGTVDLPANSRLTRVSVVAGASAATITIGGGDTITVPANGAFDESIEGEAVDLSVVIGGVPASYYVAWKEVS